MNIYGSLMAIFDKKHKQSVRLVDCNTYYLNLMDIYD